MGCCGAKSNASSNPHSAFASKIGRQTLSDFHLSKELKIAISFSAKNHATMIIQSIEIEWDGVKQVDRDPKMELKFNGSSKQITGNFETESQTYNNIAYKLQFSLTTKNDIKYIHVSGMIGKENIPKNYQQEFHWSFVKSTKVLLM